MSRTIRCKKYAPYKKGTWTKAFGNNWEYSAYQGKRDLLPGECYRDSYIIRAHTAREKYHLEAFSHGESRHANYRSPSRWHRLYREQSLRTYNKQELRRELTGDEYEGVYEANPHSCWWDWS